jgi:hypothetical protein
VSEGGTGSNSKIGDYKIYVYDYDRTKFAYVGLKDANGGQYTEQDALVSDMTQSYETFLQELAKQIHTKANPSNNSDGNKKTNANGDSFVVKYRSKVAKENFSGQAFADQKTLAPDQEKIIELKHALVALNPEFFGNSFEITEEQIDKELNSRIDATLMVPLSLIVGDLKVKMREVVSSANKVATTIDSVSNDPEIGQIITDTVTGAKEAMSKLEGSFDFSQYGDMVQSMGGQFESISRTIQSNVGNLNASNALDFAISHRGVMS